MHSIERVFEVGEALGQLTAEAQTSNQDTIDPIVSFQYYCSSNALEKAELLLAQNFSALTDLASPHIFRALAQVPMADLGAFPLLLGARFLTGLSDSSTPISWLQRNFHKIVSALESKEAALAPYQVLAREGLLTAINRAMGDGVTAFRHATKMALSLEERDPIAFAKVRESIPLAHALTALTYAHLDHYDLAFHQYRLCEIEAELSHDIQEISRGLGGQAYVSALQGDMRMAKDKTTKSLEFQSNYPGQISLGKISTDIAAIYLDIEQFDFSASAEGLDRIGRDYLGVESWPRIAYAAALTDLHAHGPLVAQAQLNEVLWSSASRPPIVESLHNLLHALQAKLIALTGDFSQPHGILSDLDPNQPTVILASAQLALLEGEFEAAATLALRAEETVAKQFPAAHRFRVEAHVYAAIAALRLGNVEVAKQQGARLLGAMQTLDLFSPISFVRQTDLQELFALLERNGHTEVLSLLSDLPLCGPTVQIQQPLSDTEGAVLRAISAYTTVPKAATALYLSPNTVKFHLKNIYRKIGATNRKEALAKARGMSLL
ncbi:LuxR C-terminal-related transcriptional regulator [Jonesiaceae bacterium BS-20]|uniref:LuxR C-terminal-related transcriptional regulator n=1 Tax=Jonesiaceae bacterium BS-20 TaxID=3120821 RepID=A0AAU7DXT7_9MICO